MSTTQAPVPPDVAEDHANHPTPSQYVRIAIILGVLTALEVSTYFFEFGPIGIPLLIVLMAIKFVIVASWFMHLKFDTKVFSRLMYTGLALALVLYAATLLLLFIERAPTV